MLESNRFSFWAFCDRIFGEESRETSFPFKNFELSRRLHIHLSSYLFIYIGIPISWTPDFSSSTITGHLTEDFPFGFASLRLTIQLYINFLNQFPFPLEGEESGIQLYLLVLVACLCSKHLLKLRQFSTECRKTKSKVITLANHKGRRAIHWSNQNSKKQIHVADMKRGKTFASKSQLVWFTTEWLRKWLVIFNPTERINAKAK